MKQWRREAQAVNQQRELELATVGRISTPTARVQKNQRMYLEKLLHIKGGASGNWLLNGLLMRAGLLVDLGIPNPHQSLPNVDPAKLTVEYTAPGFLSGLSRKLRSFLSRKG